MPAQPLGRKSLSALERQILTLSAEGLSGLQIAAKLGRDEYHVVNVKLTIKGKLGTDRWITAVSIAAKRKLIAFTPGFEALVCRAEEISPRLSDQEIAMFEWLAWGSTLREIAGILSTPYGTLDAHKNQIFKLFGASTSLPVVSALTAIGAIEPPTAGAAKHKQADIWLLSQIVSSRTVPSIAADIGANPDSLKSRVRKLVHRTGGHTLAHAVRIAIRTGKLLPTPAQYQLVRHARGVQLEPIEQYVLQELSFGRERPDLIQTLGGRPNIVKTALQRVYRKLQVSNLPSAVAVALWSGQLKDPIPKPSTGRSDNTPAR